MIVEFVMYILTKPDDAIGCKDVKKFVICKTRILV